MNTINSNVRKLLILLSSCTTDDAVLANIVKEDIRKSEQYHLLLNKNNYEFITSNAITLRNQIENLAASSFDNLTTVDLYASWERITTAASALVEMHTHSKRAVAEADIHNIHVLRNNDANALLALSKDVLYSKILFAAPVEIQNIRNIGSPNLNSIPDIVQFIKNISAIASNSMTSFKAGSNPANITNIAIENCFSIFGGNVHIELPRASASVKLKIGDATIDALSKIFSNNALFCIPQANFFNFRTKVGQLKELLKFKIVYVPFITSLVAFIVSLFGLYCSLKVSPQLWDFAALTPIPFCIWFAATNTIKRGNALKIIIILIFAALIGWGGGWGAFLILKKLMLSSPNLVNFLLTAYLFGGFTLLLSPQIFWLLTNMGLDVSKLPPAFAIVLTAGFTISPFFLFSEINFSNQIPFRPTVAVSTANTIVSQQKPDRTRELKITANRAQPVNGKEFSVSASGYLNPSGGLTYNPQNAIDENLSTWWTPSPNRDGKNSWIRLDFNSTKAISAIDIVVGSHYANYPNYGNLWYKNNRLTKAIIQFSNGNKITAQMNDIDEVQRVQFQPQETRYIIIYPLEWNRGSQWNDLCISYLKAIETIPSNK